MKAGAQGAGRRLLVVGSGAQFSGRLAQACSDAGWMVTTLVPRDPMALPPTAWMPLEDRDEHRDLITAAQTADAVITLGGVGPATAVADDARTLDTVLAHARPGTTLLAVGTIAVFGDAGSRPRTESDTPEPPDALEPARASEIRVLDAADLRSVVLRTGLVYGTGGGDLLAAAVTAAAATGVSRYFGRESDVIPTVHEDDLVALTLDLLRREDVTGVVHAVSGSTSVQGLAHLIAARAGVTRVEAWDEESMRTAFGAAPHVARINLTGDVARSRAVAELGWRPQAPTLSATLSLA